MFKPTKVPWWLVLPDSNRPSQIGVCGHDGQVTIYDAPLTNETEANAKLICAAPDLLEACRQSLRVLDEISPGDHRKMAVLPFLRSVIAKAEGRES